MRDNSPVFHWVILFLFAVGVGWMTFLVEPRLDSRLFHPGAQAIPKRIIEKKLVVPESSAPPQAAPTATPEVGPIETPQAVPDATPQAVPDATPQVAPETEAPETQSWQ